MRLFNKILIVIGLFTMVYLFGIGVVSFMVNTGMTNSASIAVEIPKEEVYMLPDDTMNSTCVKFILNGIRKRKTFYNEIVNQSYKLGVDKNIVLSALLGEQIRISCKGVRGDLKDIILKGTPTLLRSYNVSVGVGGIKVTTAYQIKKQACDNWYGDGHGRDEICNDIITEEKLSKDDAFNAKYAVYLVDNIIRRRHLSGYDISKDAGIVGTLYNMGNPKDKIPHDNPKIGGAIIKIGDKEFAYGQISLGVFNYLQSLEGND